MSKIHVQLPSGETATYTESELRGMWARGELPNDTRYRTDDMPQWQPLMALFAFVPTMSESVDEVVVEAENASSDPEYYHLAKPTGALTAALTVMLGLFIVLNVINVGHNVNLLYLVEQSRVREVPLEILQASDTRAAILGGVAQLLGLIVAITFFFWLHRSNKNCRGFRAVGMRFTPNWCVGCYFVPFANLVWPYQSMKEIWQASKNPRNWKREPAPLVGWWWGMYILGIIATHFAQSIQVAARMLTDFQAVAYSCLVVNAVSFILCGVAIAMIRGVHRNQAALVESSPMPTAPHEPYRPDFSGL